MHCSGTRYKGKLVIKLTKNQSIVSFKWIGNLSISNSTTLFHSVETPWKVVKLQVAPNVAVITVGTHRHTHKKKILLNTLLRTRRRGTRLKKPPRRGHEAKWGRWSRLGAPLGTFRVSSEVTITAAPAPPTKVAVICCYPSKNIDII